jgi:hypothetical protein
MKLLINNMLFNKSSFFWEESRVLKQEKNLQVLDETLPNFIKTKHPRKGEKKNQGARTKVQASKQPKRSGPQGGKGATKYHNLH